MAALWPNALGDLAIMRRCLESDDPIPVRAASLPGARSCGARATPSSSFLALMTSDIHAAALRFRRRASAPRGGPRGGQKVPRSVPDLRLTPGGDARTSNIGRFVSRSRSPVGGAVCRFLDCRDPRRVRCAALCDRHRPASLHDEPGSADRRRRPVGRASIGMVIVRVLTSRNSVSSSLRGRMTFPSREIARLLCSARRSAMPSEPCVRQT